MSGPAPAPARTRRLPATALAPLGYLLLALLGHLPAFRSLARTTQCACRDAPQTDWFLSWTPHALLAGRSPLTTEHLNVPDGVNLMWNTLLPLPGLLAAPVTLTAGPLAAHTLLAVAAFTGSATAAWWVAGRWAPWGWARAAAGLLYGFSPYLVAQGTGHLNLSLVALPPLVLLLLDDLLVRQERSAVRSGVLLGLVTLVQLLTTEEVLASLLVVAVAGLAVLLVQQRARLDRARVRHAVTGLAVAAGLLTLLAAYPLLVQFGGEQRVTAPVQDTSRYAADLLGTVVPTTFQVLGTDASAGWGGNASENGSYLGLPLVALLVALAVHLRALPLVRWLAGTGLAAWVLSLGSSLRVGGRDTGVPLPFAAVERLPVLENLAAVRLALYVVLAAALLLAVGLDRLHASGALARHPRRAAAVALACLLPLVPTWPYAYVEADVPGYFTGDGVRAVPEGSVAVTYPVPRYPESAPMLWQAVSGFRYRSPGGYVITPDGDGAGTFRGGVTDLERVFADVRRGAPVPRSGTLDLRVLRDLRDLDADSLLVARQVAGSREASRYLTGLLRRGPDTTAGGVDAWYGVRADVRARVRPRG